MREAAFHFEATPQTLLQAPAMTFSYPTLSSNTSWESKLSTGLGTEYAVWKSFYLSFVLALLSSVFILNIFLHMPEGCGSLFITKSIDQSVGRGLIFSIVTRFPGKHLRKSGSSTGTQYLPPKGESIVWCEMEGIIFLFTWLHWAIPHWLLVVDAKMILGSMDPTGSLWIH